MTNGCSTGQNCLSQVPSALSSSLTIDPIIAGKFEFKATIVDIGDGSLHYTETINLSITDQTASITPATRINAERLDKILDETIPPPFLEPQPDTKVKINAGAALRFYIGQPTSKHDHEIMTEVDIG